MFAIAPFRAAALAVVFSLPFCASAADPVDPEFRKAAIELLAYLRTDEQLARVRETMVRREVESDKRWEEFQDELKAHLERYMGWVEVREFVIARYAAAFTEEDLKAILAFYRSPAGVKVLNHMERLKEEGFYAGVEAARSNLEELRFKMLEEGQRAAAESAKGAGAPKQ